MPRRKDVNFYGIGFIVSLMFLGGAQCAFASPRAQLKQYVSQIQAKPDDKALREKTIQLAASLKPAPAVPEEARAYFVRGNSALKDAKEDADYDRAIERYKQAVNLAPWFGDAYFNMAKAQELRNRYDDAISSLKFYLLASPNAPDARGAKDKIYELEEKRDAAISAAPKDNRPEFLKKLDGGTWRHKACPDGYPQYCLEHELAIRGEEIVYSYKHFDDASFVERYRYRVPSQRFTIPGERVGRGGHRV